LTQKLLENDDDASILSQLYQLFNEDFAKEIDNRKYNLDNLLILLSYVYSIIGEDSFYGIEEENRMKVGFILRRKIYFKNKTNYFIYFI
jgi:hypothetical protein